MVGTLKKRFPFERVRPYSNMAVLFVESCAMFCSCPNASLTSSGSGELIRMRQYLSFAGVYRLSWANVRSICFPCFCSCMLSFRFMRDSALW